MKRLADRLIDRLTRRAPDKVIGGADHPYLLRWHVVARNRWLNVYLHHFLRSDDDRALHDHPWVSVSWLLRGDYIEHTATGWVPRIQGSIVFRRAKTAHRIELFEPVGDLFGDTWTLFITGPRVREWGFHCQRGWIHWREFTSDDGLTTGKGCDA